MLGLPDDADDKATVRHLKDAYRNPVRPVTVDHGPCKENILTGDAIDLEQFPAPRWHATDGGKFIDTFCGVITHDPTTDGLISASIAARCSGRPRSANC